MWTSICNQQQSVMFTSSCKLWDNDEFLFWLGIVKRQPNLFSLFFALYYRKTKLSGFNRANADVVCPEWTFFVWIKVLFVIMAFLFSTRVNDWYLFLDILMNILKSRCYWNVPDLAQNKKMKPLRKNGKNGKSDLSNDVS